MVSVYVSQSAVGSGVEEGEVDAVVEVTSKSFGILSAGFIKKYAELAMMSSETKTNKNKKNREFFFGVIRSTGTSGVGGVGV